MFYFPSFSFKASLVYRKIPWFQKIIFGEVFFWAFYELWENIIPGNDFHENIFRHLSILEKIIRNWENMYSLIKRESFFRHSNFFSGEFSEMQKYTVFVWFMKLNKCWKPGNHFLWNRAEICSTTTCLWFGNWIYYFGFCLLLSLAAVWAFPLFVHFWLGNAIYEYL